MHCDLWDAQTMSRLFSSLNLSSTRSDYLLTIISQLHTSVYSYVTFKISISFLQGHKNGSRHKNFVICMCQMSESLNVFGQKLCIFTWNQHLPLTTISYNIHEWWTSDHLNAFVELFAWGVDIKVCALV